MATKSQQGQLLIELLMSVMVFLTCILIASRMLLTAKSEARKYDKIGTWRNYGKN